jgi:putative endonuclease
LIRRKQVAEVLRFAEDDRVVLGDSRQSRKRKSDGINVHPSHTRALWFCDPERSEGPMQTRTPKTYFVYIMTNRSKTLYTGVTNCHVKRVRDHKAGVGSAFTTKYRLDRLVYFDRFEDVRNAIEREKRIKGWLRSKKIALIVSVNPEWRDLSLEWEGRHQFQPGQEIA